MNPIPLDANEAWVEDFDFSFSYRNYSSSGEGRIFVVLVPVPRIELRIQLSDVPENLRYTIGMHTDEFLLSANEINLNMLITGIHGQSGNGPIDVTVTPVAEPSTLRGFANDEFSKIQFRIFNMRDVVGTRREIEEHEGDQCWVDHMDLVGVGYSVDLFAFVDTRERVKQMLATGQYQQTHGALVEGAECFTNDTAKRVLEDVMLFLSFSNGSYMRPCCAQGVAEEGQIVWSHLGSPDSRKPASHSWFDCRHGSQLVEAYPLWSARMSSESWRKCLFEVVQLYLAAADPSKGVEGGLILSQTALERLSYEIYVLNK